MLPAPSSRLRVAAPLDALRDHAYPVCFIVGGEAVNARKLGGLVLGVWVAVAMLSCTEKSDSEGADPGGTGGNTSSQGTGGNRNTGDPSGTADDTVFDHRTTDVSQIPADAIAKAASSLHVAYWHTSHGSQVVSGMEALRDFEESAGRFAFSADGSSGLHFDTSVGNYDQACPDLSNCSDNSAMLEDTRRILADHPDINVVMWAWCSISGHDVGKYLENMEALIAEFGSGGTSERASTTPVEFIFMTGHSEGGNTEPREAAAQIRAHCEANGRWLIDYYDIESHDIDGNGYAARSIADNLAYDGGNWAVEYLARDDADSTLVELTRLTSSCAHSDSPSEATLNCVLKGQAAWWAFARIAGWNPE